MHSRCHGKMGLKISHIQKNMYLTLMLIKLNFYKCLYAFLKSIVMYIQFLHQSFTRNRFNECLNKCNYISNKCCVPIPLPTHAE